MLIDELHANKEAIVALASRYGARRIRIFGSVARGEERPDSNVDFPRGYDLFTQHIAGCFCQCERESLFDEKTFPLIVTVTV